MRTASVTIGHRRRTQLVMRLNIAEKLQRRRNVLSKAGSVDCSIRRLPDLAELAKWRVTQPNGGSWRQNLMLHFLRTDRVRECRRKRRLSRSKSGPFVHFLDGFPRGEKFLV